jgi:phenylacetate-CoA ligase
MKTPSIKQRHAAVSAPDFMPLKKLRALQGKRLRSMVEGAYANVAHFRKKMDARKVKPRDIKGIDDIQLLPFSEKNDLRTTYPFGLFASPMKDVVRLHASSGTTGKPIVVGYTARDMEVWKNVIMRTLSAAGMHSGDILQNAFGYGLFTGGLGLHYGAEALGATVIPISGGNTERQIMLLCDLKVTAICCTPTYFIHLMEEAEKMGVNLKKLPLRVGVFGAEPWTEGMRLFIEKGAGINAFDIYGLTEIIGPGVAAECDRHCGLHVFEDFFYPEIIDPASGKNLPDGKEGELVLSTLQKEATPMLRYRTHDMTMILPEPCRCGRTLRRIKRVDHRSDDMFIIRGVNVYPSQIEVALLKVEKTLPYYLIILTRVNGLDQVEVQVEVTKDVFSDRIGEMENLGRKISQSIEHVVGLRMNVRLVEPRTIERSQGKAKYVIDRRNMNPGAKS